MADRAEKCALDIQSRRSTISVKEMAEVIRSHYPDDRELLEAAKDVSAVWGEDSDPVEVQELNRAFKRLRTAIERRS